MKCLLQNGGILGRTAHFIRTQHLAFPNRNAKVAGLVWTHSTTPQHWLVCGFCMEQTFYKKIPPPKASTPTTDFQIKKKRRRKKIPLGYLYTEIGDSEKKCRTVIVSIQQMLVTLRGKIHIQPTIVRGFQFTRNCV